MFKNDLCLRMNSNMRIFKFIFIIFLCFANRLSLYSLTRNHILHDSHSNATMYSSGIYASLNKYHYENKTVNLPDFLKQQNISHTKHLSYSCKNSFNVTTTTKWTLNNIIKEYYNGEDFLKQNDLENTLNYESRLSSQTENLLNDESSESNFSPSNLIRKIKIPEVPQLAEKVILDYFQIPDRPKQAEVIYYNLRLQGWTHHQAAEELDSIYGNPPVSKATFFKVLAGMKVRFLTGLNFTDIYNIITLIYICRFTFLTLRYNVFSAVIILAISYFVCDLWLEELKQCLGFNEMGLAQRRVFHDLINGAYQSRRTYHSTFGVLLEHYRLFPEYSDTAATAKLKQIILTTDPICFILNSLVGSITHSVVLNEREPNYYVDYYIDPIALLVRRNTFETVLSWCGLDNSAGFKIYYWLFQDVIGKILQMCVKTWLGVKKLAKYTGMTRVGKKYCPYFIRWHWTFITFFNIISEPLNYRIHRLQKYRALTLFKRTYLFYLYEAIERDFKFGYFYLKLDKRVIDLIKGFPEKYVEKNLLAIKQEGALIDIWLLSIGQAYTAHYIYGLLHASLSQYFYTPFLTENTEHHVGFRDPTSIYSGGLTAWQDDEPIRDKRLYVKLWYGWFGRGTKNKSVLVLLLLMPINLIKQIILWIFRLLFKKKKKRKRKRKPKRKPKRRRRKI